MAFSIGGISSEPVSDLATLLSKGTVDEKVLKLYAEKGLLDIPDEDGRTPLMIACLEGLEDVVKFLLENGVNPNSKSPKEANTPLHYACIVEGVIPSDHGDLPPNDDKPFMAWYCLSSKYKRNDPTRSIVSIVNLLLSFGAIVDQNNHKWSPPCVAAFYQLNDVVDFFLAMDNDVVPLGEKIKAAELLGVSTALSSNYYGLEHIYHFFSRAIFFQQSAGLPTRQPVTSELAAHFSKVSWKECQTEEELEDMKESRVRDLKPNALLIGERLYPQKLKQYVLYPLLVIFFALNLWNKNMWDEYFQVLSCALSCEHQCDLKLGSVAHTLARYFDVLGSPYPPDEGQLSQHLQHIRDLLCEYESVLHQVHIDSLSANVDSILRSFGEILLTEAFHYSTVDILQSTLQAIEKSVRFIRRRIHEENPKKFNDLCSVAFHIMSRLQEKFHCEINLNSFRRVRFVILKILFCDSASYKCNAVDYPYQLHVGGDTLLHLVANYAKYSKYKVYEYLGDLARAFIRHGCPIDAVNEDGDAAKDLIFKYHKDGYMQHTELLSLLSQPTSLHALEEIAIREILRHNLNYKETLPQSLCKKIEGGLNDSDLI